MVSVDVRGGRVTTAGWTEGTQLSTAGGDREPARRAGRSELVFTNVDRDGMLQGPDLAEVDRVAEAGARARDLSRAESARWRDLEGLVALGAREPRARRRDRRQGTRTSGASRSPRRWRRWRFEQCRSHARPLRWGRAPQARDPLPGRRRAAAWSRASNSSTSATPATRSSWRRTTTAKARMSWCSWISPRRTSGARRSWSSRGARRTRCSCRSRSAAGSARWQDAQAVLDAGADKVSVNSAALQRPELIDELARVFGTQCVVLAIDAKARAPGAARASWRGGAGRRIWRVGARRPAATWSSGRARRSSAARARSC